jgi:hypothetical protein
MDTQLYAALLALGLLVIGSIGAFVKALTDRVISDLADNTRLTRETKQAADGSLRQALADLATARNTVFGLRVVVREREDRLAYILARHPEAEETLRAYRDRRQQRATAAEESAAERRILDDVDDPTGTDAGAHPHG